MSRSAACARSLQHFLDLSLTANAVSEPLLAFPASKPASDARGELEARSFDIAGIRDDGKERVLRYVRVEALTSGTCGDCAELVRLDEVVAKATPLHDCLASVVGHGRVFVLGQRGIEEIITRADLEKQPVRLLLFGVISALEMAMLDLIRQSFPNGAWEARLSEERLRKAREVLQECMARNEEIDLTDCLQICDKVKVLLALEGLTAKWGFDSKSEARKFFDRIQRLRDRLAHAQDPASGSSWDKVVSLLEHAETILDTMIRLLEQRENLR